MKQYLKIGTDKIFTSFIYELMQKNENFVVFENNNQVLSEHEYDDWIKEHSVLDGTARIIYRKLSDGYIIKRIGCILNLTVSNDLLNLTYEKFMESI